MARSAAVLAATLAAAAMAAVLVAAAATGVLPTASGRHGGHTSVFFRRCMRTCVEGCRPSAAAAVQPASGAPLPWSDRLFWRTCGDACDYECMWSTVGVMEHHGVGLYKFHGKWPFVKVLGVTEPLSMLFSVANLAPHVLYLARHRRRFAPSGYRHGWLWLVDGGLASAAWASAAVYHVLNRPWSERLDHYTAFVFLLFDAFAACVRVADWGAAGTRVAAGVGVAVLGAHGAAMAATDWRHELLVAFAGAAVVVGSGAWIGWAAWRRPPHWRHIVACRAAGLAFASLEVLDFPPLLYLLDAHALCHLLTAPLQVAWYRMLCVDAGYMTSPQPTGAAEAAAGGAGKATPTSASVQSSKQPRIKQD